MANKVVRFLDEVKAELKKVSWSTREELIGSTAIVLATTALLALFIGVCDFILSKALSIIIR